MGSEWSGDSLDCNKRKTCTLRVRNTDTLLACRWKQSQHCWSTTRNNFGTFEHHVGLIIGSYHRCFNKYRHVKTSDVMQYFQRFGDHMTPLSKSWKWICEFKRRKFYIMSLVFTCLCFSKTLRVIPRNVAFFFLYKISTVVFFLWVLFPTKGLFYRVTDSTKKYCPFSPEELKTS